MSRVALKLAALKHPLDGSPADPKRFRRLVYMDEIVLRKGGQLGLGCVEELRHLSRQFGALSLGPASLALQELDATRDTTVVSHVAASS